MAGLSNIRPEVLLGGGVLVGLGAGYAAGRYLLEKKYRDYAEQEIASVKRRYTVERKLPQQPVEKVTDLPKPDVQVRVEVDAEEFRAGVQALEERIVQLDYTKAVTSREPQTDPAEVAVHNLFNERDVHPDLGGPYIIGDQDYMVNEESWAQVTMTWYEGGETLAYDDDQIETDIDATVGMANLLKFGDPGVDRSTMYVANPRTSTLYEIARLEGTYEEIVLGFRAGGEPSEPRVKRMPREDRDG